MGHLFEDITVVKFYKRSYSPISVKMVELNTFNSILSWIVKKDLAIPAELLFASLAEWKVRLILLHCAMEILANVCTFCMTVHYVKSP